MHHWNAIAIDASGLDHTPVAPGENRVFGEQLGPGRSSRAMAIVHIAMFDAVNAIVGGYQSYTGLAPARDGTSMKAAIAQAAHDTLVALFPSQRASFDEQLAEDLSRIRAQRPGQGASPWGSGRPPRSSRCAPTTARSMPSLASASTSSRAISRGSGARIRSARSRSLWARTGARCTPFVLASADQFRVPPPPAMNSPAYTAAFDEVKRLGGDGIARRRSAPRTRRSIGIYWAYDGTPSLCAPPRLYNQIAMQIADQMGSDAVELARLLALVNVAMADAGIAIWESKYHYDFWRPVTGIRESDPGHRAHRSRATAIPRRSEIRTSRRSARRPAISTGPNFTPPFPAYPSGHAGFGGAFFQILAPVLRNRRHRVHLRIGRVQRRDAGQRRERCARSSRAASDASRRPRKRTARAGSISASTGRSTRPRASPWADAWRITSSSTRSGR